MKKTHILGLAAIAAALVIIISTAGDASSYVTFSEAQHIAKRNKDKKTHVVGTLKKNKLGDIVGIQASPDKTAFRFVMLDQNNFEQEVLHANPMPTDFEKSEQVVVVGSYRRGVFIADKILLKCPSKYQEEALKI